MSIQQKFDDARALVLRGSQALVGKEGFPAHPYLASAFYNIRLVELPPHAERVAAVKAGHMPPGFAQRNVLAIDEDYRIYYDADFVRELPLPHLAELLIHEVWHPLREHTRRVRELLGVDPQDITDAELRGLLLLALNVCGDAEINQHIVRYLENGYIAQKGILPEHLGASTGQTLEEMFARIWEKLKEQLRRPPHRDKDTSPEEQPDQQHATQQSGAQTRQTDSSQQHATQQSGADQQMGQQQGSERSGSGQQPAQQPTTHSPQQNQQSAGPPQFQGAGPSASSSPQSDPNRDDLQDIESTYRTLQERLEQQLQKKRPGYQPDYQPDAPSYPGVRELLERQAELRDNLPDLRKSQIRLQVAREMVRIARSSNSRSAGLSPELLRWAEEMIGPERIPYERIFASIVSRHLSMASTAHRRNSYRLFARRQVPGVLLPGRVGMRYQVGFLLDTSGSVSDRDLGMYLRELRGVLRHYSQMCDVTYYCADTTVHHQARLHLKDMSPEQLRLLGGGGTDMAKAIRQIDAQRQPPPPHVLFVLTDGLTPWPAERPRNIQTVVIGLVRPTNQRIPDWIEQVVPLYEAEVEMSR